MDYGLPPSAVLAYVPINTSILVIRHASILGWNRDSIGLGNMFYLIQMSIIGDIGTTFVMLYQ
jgi:hypothetical protein